MYYVYLLRCADDTLYCGVSTNWQRRLRQHASGSSSAARYTRAHPPRELAALWECGEKGDALRLEYRIKKLRREEKLRLIEEEDAFSTLPGMPDAALYRRDLLARWEAEE